jgi:uncharacterized protein
MLMKNLNNKKNKNRNNYRKALTIVVIITLIIIAVVGMFLYTKVNTSNRISKELSKPYEPAFIKNGRLIFFNKDNKDTTKAIDIEIADNDAKRAQGLMWRRSMSENTGMLFIFEDEKPLNFWMKNTVISLDIIYVNESMDIITIYDNTVPLSEMLIPSEKPAKYVVEVNAGFCYRHKVQSGDKIKFTAI